MSFLELTSTDSHRNLEAVDRSNENIRLISSGIFNISSNVSFIEKCVTQIQQPSNRNTEALKTEL